MRDVQQTHTILVIGSSPNVRTALRLAMEKAGHKVHEAHAIEALRAAPEKVSSLAVVNLSSARDEELNTLLTWQRGHRNMPIIAIAGGSRSINRLFEENPVGVVRTFLKPFELGDLVSAVEKELLRDTTRASTVSEHAGKGIMPALRRWPAKTQRFLFGDGKSTQALGLAVALLCLGFLSSCASPTATPSIRTHYIQINEQVSPRDLYVSTGDEVRWENLRTDPVKVGLLSHHQLDLVSCEKGFKRFGTVEDTATISPRGYVSLCFSRPGTVQYNVWLNPADPRGRMTPTANIQVYAIPTIRK